MELISVFGSQPAGDLVIKPVVGCYYFPPGQQLLSLPKKSPTSTWLVPNYTAWRHRHTGVALPRPPMSRLKKT